MSERGAGSRGPLIVAAVIGVVAIVVVRLAMTWGDGDDAPDPGVPFTARDGCTTVVVAASSEKAGLLGQLSQDYAASGRTVQGSCYDIKVITKASGAAEAALARGWNPAEDGEQPDVWTPAASTWVRLLEHDLQRADRPDLVPDDVQSVASTPLVLAMPRPMAESLGWPATAVGWADILMLANDPKGWAANGHPEWGNFKLGKTNPNISTSGLAATVGAFLAATGQSSDLTERDLVDKKVRAFVKSVERSVVHYGDTTLTFLANLQRADDAGTGLGYVSARSRSRRSRCSTTTRQPHRRPGHAGQHAPPQGAARRDLPEGGHAASPTTRAWFSMRPGRSPKKQAGARDFLAYLRPSRPAKRFTDAGFRTHDGTPGAPITPVPSSAPTA